MNIKVKNVAATATVVLCGFLTQTAYGVVASPDPIRFVLPDGRSLTVQRQGDEHSNYMTTTDGYLLVAEPDGEISYATVGVTGEVVSTGIKARDMAMRSIADVAMLENIGKEVPFKALEKQELRRMGKQPRRVAPEDGLRKFPTIGSPKVLVILAQYQDVKFTVTDPQKQFSDLLNKPGYSDWGASGSAFDYYNFSSNGQFRPDFDVFGPVTLENERAYYGGNSGGSDIRRAQHIVDALKAAKEQTDIDFSKYDTDNDGVVDNVYVFYAGYGEADSPEKDAIWPHAWYLKTGAGLDIEYDGKVLDHYACSAELSGSSKIMNGIGTFVHEFTHVLGIMDHYATEYSAAFTPGTWDLMDHGSYNNDQRTPPAMSVYERYCLGWLEPKELEESENVALRDIHNGGYNDVRMLSTSNPNEYYLFENRTQTGWDTYVPAEGMLVWHIDYDPSIWRQNRINNNAAHQYVDIVEADNIRTDATREGDPFPGSENVREFTDNTLPSMKTWMNEELNAPLTDITRTGNVVHFQFRGGVESEDIVELSEVKELTDKTSFTLTWTTPEMASEFLVTVENEKGEKIVDAEAAEGNTFTVEGVNPGHKYICRLNYRNGYFPVTGKAITVETLAATLDFLKVGLLEPSDITHESFTANWEELPGAEHYKLTVYEGEETPEREDIITFDNGMNNLPEGWESTVKTFYTKSDVESQPALYMRTNNQFIVSPEFESDIESLEFLYKGADNKTDRNSLVVSGLIDGQWQVLETINPIPYDAMTLFEIKQLPAGVRQIEIRYDRKAAGSVLIDNIRVFVPASGTFAPIEGYNQLNVGNTTSHKVEGLKEMSDYFFTVTAHNSEFDSMISDRGKVTTNKNSGVAEIEISADAPATFFNLQGMEVSGELTPGIYLRKSGGKVMKVVVK